MTQRINPAALTAAATLLTFTLWSCQQQPAPTTSTLPPAASTSTAPTPPAAASSPAPLSPQPSAPSTSPPATVAERFLNESDRRALKLSNGFTVLLEVNRTAPVVACRIYVKAGSLTEGKYMGAGISHVLEHLVAGASSQNKQEAQSQQELRLLGGDSNAYTTYDHTCYFITTTNEKWPQAVELLRDWTTGANFTEAQFQREYQVVQREIEMGEAEAGRTFSKLVYANRYQVHPAHHPVIGYKPAFQKLTAKDCQEYYNKMYVPDNMFISIAGDFDLDQAEKRITELFGQIRRTNVPAIALPPEPAVAAPRTAVGHADVKQARVVWAFPTVSLYSNDMYALDVLAAILGDGESSTLVRTLRDEKGLVMAISAADETPAFAPGSLEFSAILTPDQIPQAKQALLDILKDVIAKGVDPKELEKAKVQTAAALIYSNQTAEQKASKNASDFMETGNLDFAKIYVERIKAVTPEMVQAAAKKYIKPETLLTTILLPTGVPDSVAGAATQSPVTQGQVEKITLDNGLTVLISRNNSSPIVAMQLYVLGALLAEDDHNNGIGNAMMQLLQKGTKTHSQRDIAEYFDSTGGTISTMSGNNAFGVSATCLKENAEKSFDLFADVALHPAFAPDELEKLRPRLLASIDRSIEDWFGESYEFLRKSYFKDGPYRRMAVGSHDIVAKLTADNIRQHYEKFFYDPTHTVLAIYGDVSPQDAKKWAATFAAVPSQKPELNQTSVKTEGRTVTQPSKKGSATVMLGYGPGMTIDSDDRYPMTVLQTLLGGYNSPGGSILHETLRGKGLVYTVQASNIAGPAAGMFLITALGEPKNTDEIIGLIQDIVESAKTKGFTDLQIKTARDQAITGEQLRDQTIEGQAADQALDEVMGLGYDNRTHFAAKIRAVTSEDLKRVANKYLQSPIIAITTPTPK